MRQIYLVLFLFLGLSGFSQAPTVPASNITFSNIGCNQVDISWTNGNGAFRVLFVRENSSIVGVPVNNEFYTLNSQYGLGEPINGYPDHFCIYRGTGNSVTLTGLKKMTTYCFAVFEYNGASGTYDYLTSSYPTQCFKTVDIKADFTISPTEQCFNNNVFNFTNSSTSTKSPLTYKWNFGDNNTSTAQDPSHSYTTYKIFKVRLIANSPGCADTIYKFDTVHPHPVVKFDLDPTKPKNDSIQCFFGNRFTFRNSTILPDIGLGNSSMQYEWAMDHGFIQTGFKADRSFPEPGVWRIKLTATSFQGCQDSAFKYYVALPRAIDTSKVVFNAKSMCLSNNKFIVTNNSPNSISSRWIFGEGGNDSVDAKTATHTYAKTGKYYVRLKAFDARGCLDIIKDSVDVFSNTNLSFSGLKTFYCLGDPKSILKPTPGSGKFFGAPEVDPTDSSFTPRTVGKYKVGYVYSKGSCRDTIYNLTEVFQTPNVTLGADTVICVDQPLQLSVNPAYSSTWNTGQSGSTITVNKTGMVIVTSVDGNCSDKDTINIKALVTPTLTSRARDTTLCGGSYLKFDLKVDNGSVLWNDGNTDRDRVVTTSGFYKVVLANKCGAVADSFNLTVEETACVIFFPNAFTPNGDLLNDTWQPFGKYDFVRMNVYNRWGERLYTSDKSPIWDGYSNGHLCLDNVYNIVFEYLIQDGNSMKRVTKGIVVHLVR